MPAIGADPVRDSLGARMSELIAPRVAGGTGSEDGSEGRSGDPVTIEGDPTELELLGDYCRSGTIEAYIPRPGDPKGKLRTEDEGLVGCRSGDPGAIGGDPAGPR